MIDDCHGSFIVNVEDDIIYITIKGAFNSESIKYLFDEIKKQILSFAGKPFYIFHNALEFTGATPNCYKEADLHNEWLCTQNLVKKALMYSSCVFSEIDNLRVTHRKNQNYKYFDNSTDAMSWLLENN